MRAHRIVLGVLFLSFFALAYCYVPRLTNCLWSDMEFTGWVSPIAHRMAQGEHIYRDFTLPIPPGSFLVMATVQKATGRFALVDELWLCAVCNLLMIGIAYGIARSFTEVRNATLAAILTAPVIILTPKEIAYDQTAQVIAWSAVALLAAGLTRPAGRARSWYLRAAGFAAALTLAFKSSTGTGAIVGIGLAAAAIGGVAFIRQKRAAVRALLPDFGSLAAGLAAGIAATVLIVVLIAGGSLGEFYQVVFVDGPQLKGGQARLVLNLLSYSLFQSPVHLSLLVVIFTAWILVRMQGNKEALLVDAALAAKDVHEPVRFDWRFAVGVSAIVLALAGTGIGLLLGHAAMVPNGLRAIAGFSIVPPMLGLMFLAIFLLSNLHGAAVATDRRAAFAATTLCAGAISLLHNLSHPQHRPFYDNNPIIPMAFLSLLLLMDRARFPRLKYVVFVVTLFGLYGEKFQRYLDARHPVDDPSFWAGLQVSDNGLRILKMAQRARELAGPAGTVLMLPEDPATEALIGRPRPKLHGAIVFVDQFPERMLKHDLLALQMTPPDVLVLHPNDNAWNRVYRIWNLKAPAGKLQVDFLEGRRETMYRIDSTYPTWIFNQPSTMELLYKAPPAEPAEPPQ
ncbi:MAG: hypothetical protein HY898_22705 [Deltaproteobacteria bacterium]|nr:hypothetical protein [Deltaproteobacteria bacterium]